MSSTDDRIVNMKFNNADFKRGAEETQKDLANLNKAVDGAGKSTGLLDIKGQMEKVQITASNMSVAVASAIGTMVAKVTDGAIGMAKSLSLDPISQGFDEYELKMKSIQTILANTKGENLGTVTTALQELNEYSDKTIYNFANMTQNIGKLTTAGIGLDDATATVKGFSNMVALAGGDATAAAGAMEQFGQGLQAGTIKAIDWMSISTRGLGSQQLQKAFFETARAAGELKDVPLTTSFEEWSKAQGGFKGSLESGWLTTQTATDTLKIMTGDITNLQDIMDMGFSKKAAKDMMATAKSAVESATKVRTFTAFMSTLKEQIGSGWAQVMEVIFGDFNEATALFTKLSDATGKAIGGFFEYLSGVLTAWDEMGGRTAILATIGHLLAPIGAILKVISAAWKAAFPSGGSGSGLAAASKGLEMVTRPLELLADVIEGSVGPITAFFQILKIGFAGIKELGSVVGGVLEAFAERVRETVNLDAPASGGLLDFIRRIAAAIGDALGKISTLLDKGHSLSEAFGKVDLKLPDLPGSMPKLPSALPSLPTLGAGEGAAALPAMSAGVANLKQEVLGLNDASEKTTKKGLLGKDGAQKPTQLNQAGEMVEDLGGRVESAGDRIHSAGVKIGDTFTWLYDAFMGFIKKIEVEDVVTSFNFAALGTFIYKFMKLFDALTSTVSMASSIEGMFNQVTKGIKTMQNLAKAKMIQAIAYALLALAVALLILSLIPGDKLAKALGALAVTMALMSGTMYVLSKVIDKFDKEGINAKMLTMSVAVMALGLAMIFMATAFLIFNYVDPSSVVKGLITMSVAMGLLMGIANSAAKSAGKMIAGAFAITAIAYSMIVLAGALLLFKLVDWDSMVKAGVALGALALVVGLLAILPYAGIEKVGVALLAASGAMVLLAVALLMFKKIDYEEIGKLAVVLLILTASLAALMAVGNPVNIVGLVGMAFAVVLLAGAMLVLNDVEWASIGKLALVFTVLSVALLAFTGIMYLMAPVVPVVMAFGAALALLGLGMLAFAGAMALVISIGAAGVAAFAAIGVGAAMAITGFLQTLAKEAPLMKESFLEILQTLIDTIVEAVPMVIDGIKRLWEAVKAEFTGGAAKSGAKDGGKASIKSFGDGIIEKIPQIVNTAGKVIVAFLKGMKSKAKAIGAAAVEVVAKFIDGVASRIDKIVDSAINLIVAFAKGISNGLPRILQAGIDLIVKFLHDLADKIRNNAGSIGSGIKDVASAMGEVGIDMIQGLIDGIGTMFDNAIDAIGDLVGSMIDKAKEKAKIWSPSKIFKDIGAFMVQGLTNGITDHASTAIQAVANLVGGQIATANELVSNFIQDLDQKALKARAKADGLTAAAQRAAQLASKTKTKADDKKAEKIEDKARKAAEKAKKLENQAERAKEKQDREEEFQAASLIDKAKMRSEDAGTELEAAKDAEKNAAAKLIQADALEKQAKAKGVTADQKKKLRAEAKRLRKEAKEDALAANKHMVNAADNAAEALALQKQAGDEAAAQFAEQYKQEATADAEAAAFEKMSAAEKAAKRREQAIQLQKDADDMLVAAQAKAYTDMEEANEMAAEAMAMADLARQYTEDAASYAAGGGGASGGINLAPMEAAALAFNNYSDLYDASMAAAAGGPSVEFHQYNSSPESLTQTEIYRQTNNLLTHYAGKVTPTAA